MSSEVCPFDEVFPVLHLRTSPSFLPRRGLINKTFRAGPWQTYLMDHIIPSPTPQVYSPQGCQWLGGEIILQSKRSRKKIVTCHDCKRGKHPNLKTSCCPDKCTSTGLTINVSLEGFTQISLLSSPGSWNDVFVSTCINPESPSTMFYWLVYRWNNTFGEQPADF